MKLATLILLLSLPAYAQISERRAVNAIIGECGGCSRLSQLWVACAIRNRGSLRGVYGEHNPVVKRATASQRANALAVWRQSATNDVTHGLRFFGCKRDDMYFDALGMERACVVDCVTFWREK